MLQRLATWLPSARTVFLLSLTFLLLLAAFSYGFIAGYFRTFPYYQVRQIDTIREDLRNWRAFLGIRPDTFLVDSDATFDVTTDPAIAARDDVIFVSGFVDGELGMYVMERDGTILQRWNPKYFEIWEDRSHVFPPDLVPATEWHVSLHGAQPLPDGSVVFNHSEAGLVRFDRCGEVVWKLPRMTHHSVARADDGTLWVSDNRNTADDPGIPGISPPFYEPLLLQVSPEGEVLREISVTRALLAGGYAGALFPTGEGEVRNITADHEHLNDVEALSAARADAFPMFEAGDVVFSLRNLNAVVVLDPATAAVKWVQVGPWLRQHDPEFTVDGRIAVFSNNDEAMTGPDGFAGSELMVMDPLTRRFDIVFGGAPGERFFTATLGKHHATDAGTLIATVSYEGRAFEVDADGRVLWEFVNANDDGTRGILWEVMAYPRDYFEEGALTPCATS
jgi:hypothetical protein